MCMDTIIEKQLQRVVVNGVFGELLQGMRTDDEPFLVTNPVNIYTTATLYPDDCLDRIRVINSSKEKAQVLVDKMYEQFSL